MSRRFIQKLNTLFSVSAAKPNLYKYNLYMYLWNNLVLDTRCIALRLREKLIGLNIF